MHRILKLTPKVMDAVYFTQFTFMLEEVEADRLGLLTRKDLQRLQELGERFDNALVGVECSVHAEPVESEGLELLEYSYYLSRHEESALVVNGIWEHQLQNAIAILKQFGFDTNVSTAFSLGIHNIYWLMANAAATFSP